MNELSLKDMVMDDGSPLRMQIVTGMARAFFASAWAEQCEEAGRSSMLSGKDIMQVMPSEMDSAAMDAGTDLAYEMERINGKSMDEIYEAHKDKLTPELFGHYAAMQAMGHGVGLRDYNVHINVPYMEFGSFDLERDYFEESGDAE